MIQELEKKSTLLVKGPTRITLIKGKIEVFGKEFIPKKEEINSKMPALEEQNVLIVPSATSFPLHALEDSKVEVYTNNEKNIKLISKNSISSEWIEIKDSIIDQIQKRKNESPLKIMVLGISSGKTTLIKYLANNFIKEGLKGGYLDSDLGQQVIYLPTTLNIGKIEDFIISSEDINTEQTVFIGATFPKGHLKFIVSICCRELIDNYFTNFKETDFLLIDTDGWIKTELGIIYKNFFIKTVEPDIIIIFNDQKIEELDIIVEESLRLNKDTKIYSIKEQNEYFFEKDKEERRFLRQSQFAKVFEQFRKISIPLDDIKFIKRDYDEEKGEVIEEEIDIRKFVNLPYHYVIIALMTEESEIIKIGLLFYINIEKNYILLFSDFNYKEQIKIKKILVGSLRLSIKGNHQGYLYL
ncbi:MAG: Clp1/GlmU family protein [Promethearchaeota archaeon]